MATSTVSVRISGMKGVFMYLKRVTKRTKKEGNALTLRLAKEMVKRAKRTVAPMASGTGDLKKSIRYIETEKGHMVTAGRGVVNKAGVEYAKFQEFGFKPHSVRLHRMNPRSRLRSELEAGGVHRNQRVFVRRFTPFMGPAYRHVLNRMDTELNNTANKIVRG